MKLRLGQPKLIARWALSTVAFLTVCTATLTVWAIIALLLALDTESVAIIQEKGLRVIQDMVTYTTLTAFFISGIVWAMTILFFVIKTTPKSPAIHSYE